jgi:iron complex outermembrane recepter protein
MAPLFSAPEMGATLPTVRGHATAGPSSRRPRWRHAALATAACAALWPAFTAQAQTAGADVPAVSTTITITGRSGSLASLTGFGDLPLGRTPLQASSFGSQLLLDAGANTLADLTRLDASVGDAYNAEGYWAILSVRGYTLDNRFNYRRDGLPINAETSIGLDNKERLELLKGTSGIQAGTSAPGGLVNLVVKRPVARLREGRLELREGGGVLAAVDLSERYGVAGVPGTVGLRVNIATEQLRPQVRDADGNRSLLALATDFQLTASGLLQAEWERSRRSQPSVAGYSLLGNMVPDPKSIDLKRNLNAQPWAQPVVFEGDTASLRWQQQLADGWQLTAQAMTQRLKTDDRTAFPYGVYDANYECPDWCDRFAPDGSFTYWQYISDNERRDSDALSLTVSGELKTGSIKHQLTLGALKTRYRGRPQDQVFDIAGPGNIDGSLVSPPAFGYTDANTRRSERSTELQLSDVLMLAPQWQLWTGVRHTRLQRDSERTSPASDGLRATTYSQNATTPWLALAHNLSASTLVYGSWGQGLESDVAPNRARYTNAGQALPALKSRQVELGLKHSADGLTAAATLFDIDRPQAADIGACDVDDSCTRIADGTARHRGLELQASVDLAAWTLQGSALMLDAQRQGSAQSGVNGGRPVNVPERSLRLGVEWRVAAAPGLSLQASVTAEGDRVALPYDSSIRIGGWARVDVGARWRHTLAGTALTWRAGIDNLADRQAWKEAPYQFGHSYLYALSARQWRVSVTAAF